MTTLTQNKPRKRKRFIVTLNEVPCRLAPYDKTVIGWRLIPKRGTLVKCAAEEQPEVFPGPASAQHAVDRAIKLRGFYRTDIVEVASKHLHLVERGIFEVVEHKPKNFP